MSSWGLLNGRGDAVTVSWRIRGARSHGRDMPTKNSPGSGWSSKYVGQLTRKDVKDLHIYIIIYVTHDKNRTRLAMYYRLSTSKLGGV